MSVFTPVSEGEAASWLKGYSVGALEALEPIAAGIENTNYYVTTGEGRYVLTLFERKVSADIQNRVGPNRVGPWGSLQFLVDGVKLFLKEDIIPAAADGNLFRLAPYIVFSATMLAAVVIPFGPFIVADLNIGLIFIIVVSSLVVVGFLMSGWASNNKWALLGGIRSAAQIISYEIPAAISLLLVHMKRKSA